MIDSSRHHSHPTLALTLAAVALTVILPARSEDAGPEPEMRAFLKQHCHACHGPDEDKGGLRLDTLPVDFTDEGVADTWELVAERISLGEMPPEEEPQPDPATSDHFLAKVRGNLAQVGREIADVFELPGYGNYVDHELLFDPDSDAKPATPARLWRINADFYRTAMERFDAPRRDDRDVLEDYLLVLEQPWRRNQTTTWISSALPSRSPAHTFRDHARVNSVDAGTTALLAGGVLSETMKDSRYLKHLQRTYAGDEGAPDLAGAVKEVYRLALMRDPAPEKLDSLLKLGEEVAKDIGPEEAISTVAAAIFLSPEVVFRKEQGAGDPDEHGRVMLSPWELAYAIGYSLGGTVPDEALVEAAASGELETREGVRRQVERYLKESSPHTRMQTLRFFQEYFEYTHLTGNENGGTYLIADVDRLVLDIVEKDRDVLKRLLTTNRLVVEVTHPDGAGKRHYYKAYGLPKDTDLKTVAPISFPKNERAGILTHPAWLKSFSTFEGENEAIQRGRFIRTKLLGQTVPDLPVDVDAQLPDDDEMTLREKMHVTRAEYCWQCHRHMDELGLPFEFYDADGMVRTEDNKKPVDSSGEIVSGIEGLDGAVKDPVEMMHRLADSERVRQVFVRHAFRYWMGRNETVNDAPTLVAADRSYVENDGSLEALLVSLFTSDSFLYRRVEENDNRVAQAHR